MAELVLPGLLIRTSSQRFDLSWSHDSQVRDEAEIKAPGCAGFLFVVLLSRRAHSELCNQSGGEKHGQKEKRDWYFNKCLIPKPNNSDNFTCAE